MAKFTHIGMDGRSTSFDTFTGQPYVSTMAKRFAPGNFVNMGTTDKVGVTLAIKDRAEDNPLIQVKWVRDLTTEWVRSEHLTLST